MYLDVPAPLCVKYVLVHLNTSTHRYCIRFQIDLTWCGWALINPCVLFHSLSVVSSNCVVQFHAYLSLLIQLIGKQTDILLTLLFHHIEEEEEGIFHSSASFSDGAASIKSIFCLLGSAIGYKISKKFLSIYAEGEAERFGCM